MDEDEEDPVIEELPVYLSHELANHLFIYQYPVCPSDSSYDSANIIKCSIKPEHQEVALDFAMDTQSNNYDISHGEQIAINVDGSGHKSSQEKYFNSPLMDKLSLQSVRGLTDMGTVAVATMCNKQVVLSPVTGVVSLQPSFPYLDITDKRAKEEAKEQGDLDVSGGEEDEEKQVTVKFARQESERMKKARERSFNYLTKKSAEEPWYRTQYYPSTSRVAELERAKLQPSGDGKDDQTGSLCLKATEYMGDLLPAALEEMWTTPSLPSNVLSLTTLRTLPLNEQVRLVLKDVKVITFGQLSTLLAGCGDVIKLLRSVQQVAVLVLGNWVIRSDFLYPKESLSVQNGVPGEIMTRARDYILYLLKEAEGRCLDRRQIAGILKLPPEELKEILVQVARLRHNKGWMFVLPQDKDFIERYPDVVERQSMWWEAKHKQLREAFGSRCMSPSKSSRRKRESSMSGGSDMESPGRTRTVKPRRRKDSSFSSDTESGPECGRMCNIRRTSESGGGGGRTKRRSGNSESVHVNGSDENTVPVHRLGVNKNKCSEEDEKNTEIT